MKFEFKKIIFLLPVMLIIVSCSTDREEEEHPHEEEQEEVVHLTAAQMKALEMKIDTVPVRVLSSVVEANGQLEVPPQNEATVTAILGANVISIEVIEGEDVRQGQALAYIGHPSLTTLQTDYLETSTNVQFLKENYQRQQRLYEEGVGSGKAYQRAKAEYETAVSHLKGKEVQLQQLGLNTERIRNGNIYGRIPVVSPITGSVTAVKVKTGQYVAADKEIFEVVNVEHIHADLMVFEKDIFKVREGQKVRFSVQTLPGTEMIAEIYSVGKKFEKDPKAVHIHAEIKNKTGILIPGMYVKGEILTGEVKTKALPEAALAREGDRQLAFRAERDETGHSAWVFRPVEVQTGESDNGWVAVRFTEEMPPGTLFAMNNAYYIIAEMKKDEGGHGHAH